MDLRALRAANINRNAAWPGAGKFDLAYRGLELGGETGELLELLTGMGMGADHLEIKRPELAEELADVVIATDLVAMDLGVELLAPVRCSSGDILRGAADLATRVGLLQNRLKKLIRIDTGIQGQKADEDPQRREAIITEIIADLDCILDGVAGLSCGFGIDLDAAIPDKFDKTSRKNGLDAFFHDTASPEPA
ncbi:MazG-like family protein [Paracoccus litorisediminis]|uniref:MazG-like family protein n=1 Tax=Paracoccus litorisediminis TaxID=2006130 RepID=UPI00372FC0DF